MRVDLMFHFLWQCPAVNMSRPRLRCEMMKLGIQLITEMHWFGASNCLGILWKCQLEHVDCVVRS